MDNYIALMILQRCSHFVLHWGHALWIPNLLAVASRAFSKFEADSSSSAISKILTVDITQTNSYVDK